MITIGKAGLDKTWQDDFLEEVECPKCGGFARIAFVYHEDREDGDDSPLLVGLHENEGKGGFWWHDCCAVAVYACKECFAITGRQNQA